MKLREAALFTDAVHNKSSDKESPAYLQREKMRQIMKLLIVEDNAGMRRLIKSVVQDLVDKVMECEDGAGAFQAYIDFLPDWVLMDIKMPKMDGLTATLTIKNAFPDANICIVTD